jgi:Zn/Cd-binding protein ZinT
MQPACEAVASAAHGYNADDVASVLASWYATGFGALRIADGAMRFYAADGVTLLAECDYEFTGVKMASFGEYEFPWYTFEARSVDGACAEYRHVIATEIHAHEGGMPHWHMRYGDRSVDELIHDSTYAAWWPTLRERGTTAQQVAGEMLASAEEFAAMLPPRLVTRLSTNELVIAKHRSGERDTLDLEEASTEQESGRTKLCICRAIGFRIGQMLSGMWDDGAFHPDDVSVVTGWSTDGMREIFEDVLGVAAFAYAENATDSENLRLDDSWYEVTILSTGERLTFRGTDRMYSKDFLELRSRFKKGGATAAPKFVAGRSEVADAVKTVPFERMLLVED